jgi:hypothetical protein
MSSHAASYRSPSSEVSASGRLRLLGLYVLFLAFATIALSTLLLLKSLPLSPPASLPPVWQLVFFLALNVLAEKATIQVSRECQVTPSLITCFLGVVVLGTLPMLMVAVVSQVVHFTRREWMRNVCFAATAGLQVGLTGLIYWTVVQRLGSGASITILAGVAAGVGYQLINYILVLPVGLLRTGHNPLRLWREGVQPFLPYHLFFLAVSLGLVWIFNRSQSIVAFLLLLLPVLGLIYSFRAYSAMRDQVIENQNLALRNERLAMQSIAALVTTLDAKDNYTSRHSAAVAQWATALAEDMGLKQQEIELTHLAGLMHDVGKIGISDRVLKGEGPLDNAGRAEINTHPRVGSDILAGIDAFRELAQVILYHHERYDGKGYPLGAKGEEIPLISRIIGVADAYSAMMMDRPYRSRLPLDVAKDELRKNRGTQFDPRVVDHFLQILERSEVAYQLGEQADFKLEFQKVKFMRGLPQNEVDDVVLSEGAA